MQQFDGPKILYETTQPVTPLQKLNAASIGTTGTTAGQGYLEAVIRIRIRIHQIHIFLGLPDPDPLVRDMDPNIFLN
jgi:hypothetical protein